MSWYAAHIIIGFLTDGAEQVIAWDNVTLIRAATHEEAEILAKQIGHELGAPDDGLTINGVSGKSVFAGIRKILSIDNFSADDTAHGSEITFSEFVLKNALALEKLAAGEDISLIYTAK